MGVLASTHAVASYPGVSLVNLEPGFEASYACSRCALWVITDSCHNPCAPVNRVLAIDITTVNQL